MTVVLVNGNPETPAIWDPLCEHLDRADVVRLAPPGFGTPIPDGFGCSVADYEALLVAGIEDIGEPVDLVGHDIGGIAVVCVAMARPDLLRTWVSDSVGVFHPDYVWHDLAQQWQTPGVAERSVRDRLGGSTEERTERLVGRGIDRPVAEKLAAAQGPEMARAILAFYPSAVQPAMAELGRSLPAAAARPGLAVLSTDDHLVGSPQMRREAAARAGARVATFEELGHWWMVQDPSLAASALTSFWAEHGGAVRP